LSVPSSALKGYRFPSSAIGYAVWAYHRFALSLQDIENLLAERGITVSHETIRVWVTKFGTRIAAKIRRNRPQPPTSCTWMKLLQGPQYG
jgi:putative transposase